MPVQQLFQTAQRHRPGDLFLLRGPGQRPALQKLEKVLTHRLFHKQGLGVLGQNAQPAHRLQLPAAGLQQAGEQLQAGGLAGAVPPQQGQKFPPPHRKGQALHHVGQVLFILEPQVPGGDGGLRRIGVPLLLRERSRGVSGGETAQPVPSLPDGDGAGGGIPHRRPDAHGCGHGLEHGVARVLQGGAHLAGGAGAQEPAPVQHRHAAGQGEGLLQPVLGEENGGAQLSVDLAQSGQEIGRGDGVQLTGGLVQNQHRGLHGHDRGQIQKLLLSAGQLGDVFVKPGLDAEKGGHFGHPPADGGGVIAQALQAEGQLMPHLIGDELVLRGLEYEANARRLLPLVQLVQGDALKADLPQPVAMGGQHRLELAQQGGFAAARRAAQHPKFPRPDGQVQPVQGGDRLPRVKEGQVMDRKRVHWRSSLRSMMTGVRHKSPNASSPERLQPSRGARRKVGK